MMLRRMFEDVVSVARPGSSDGGSVPQFTVMTCSAAAAPPVSPPAVLPPELSSSPPQPAATSARPARTAASHGQPLLSFICLPSFEIAGSGQLGGGPPCLSILPECEETQTGEAALSSFRVTSNSVDFCGFPRGCIPGVRGGLTSGASLSEGQRGALLASRGRCCSRSFSTTTSAAPRTSLGTRT